MNNKGFYITAVVLIAASIGFWIYMFQGTDQAIAEGSNAELYEGEINLTMYHSEGCGCCVKWAEYLEDNGVNVTSELMDNSHEFKNEQNVPRQLRSCHTALVDGYVIEGHVHVEDIQRLLAERPDAIGLSAPGMPPNSPGMDQPVENEYEIVLFDEEENMSVYAVHN
ncbi:MAG: DUF411 domain-containing protein [Balneolaceae bacterium]